MNVLTVDQAVLRHFLYKAFFIVLSPASASQPFTTQMLLKKRQNLENQVVTNGLNSPRHAHFCTQKQRKMQFLKLLSHLESGLSEKSWCGSPTSAKNQRRRLFKGQKGEGDKPAK